jgi:hypothetical protein
MHDIATAIGVSHVGFQLMIFVLCLGILCVPLWFTLRQIGKDAKTNLENQVRAALDQIDYDKELAEWKERAAKCDGKIDEPPPMPPDWSWS